jgi:hypothetical protein
MYKSFSRHEIISTVCKNGNISLEGKHHDEVRKNH